MHSTPLDPLPLLLPLSPPPRLPERLRPHLTRSSLSKPPETSSAPTMHRLLRSGRLAATAAVGAGGMRAVLCEDDQAGARARSGLAAAKEGPATRKEGPTTRRKLLQVKQEVDDVYRGWMRQQHIPGLAYAIAVDGEIVLENYLGDQQSAEGAAGAPVTPETRFRIASMTKSFTAMAILQLRDMGLLRLDDPVAMYAPELSATAHPALTLRHLLTMQAGLPQDDPWADRLLDQPPADFARFLASGITHSNDLGVEFEYSNLAYAILGLVVSNVSGMSYQQFIRRHTLLPLGMTSTTFDVDDVPPNCLARGHRWVPAAPVAGAVGGGGGHWVEEPMLGDGSYGAMGGLVTTVRDFSKYMALHSSASAPRSGGGGGGGGGDESAPLSATSLREMRQPHTIVSLFTDEKHPTALEAGPGSPLLDASPATARVAAYGMGLVWNKDSRGIVHVRHSGGLPGFGSEWRFLPHSQGRVAIVSFGNRTYCGMMTANNVVMDLLVARGVVTGDRRHQQQHDVDDCGHGHGQQRPTVLDERAKQLANVLAAGLAEGGDLQSLFADNFFLDRGLEQWQSHSRAVIGRLGAGVAVVDPQAHAVEPIGDNKLRASFFLVGHLGDRVKVTFTLTPEARPRVQEVTLAYVGFQAK